MLKHILIVCMVLSLFVVAMPDSHSIAQNDDALIVIGTLDLPTSLDPAMADTFMEFEILNHLYTGLTRQVVGSSTYELAAATNHQVSSDGLTHTFTLRDDLVFSDGSPITAETFQRSIQRVQNLDEGGATLMDGILGDVVAVDAVTLQFNLRSAIPYFEALVSLPPFFAVHPDDFPAGRLIREHGALVGNGPYVLQQWEDGPILTLLPNPIYQFDDVPQNTGVVLRYFTDTEALRVALLQGDIDVAWRDVRLPDAVTTAEINREIELATVPSVRMWYMVINVSQTFNESTGDPILRDIFVRMLNRELVTEDYFEGLLAPSYSLVPELVGDAYSPIYSSFEDSEEALTILQDNNYSPNRPVFMSIVTSEGLYGSYHANAINTLRVGLTPTNRYINVSGSTGFAAQTFIERLQDGGFPITVFAFTPVVPHPDAYLRPLLHSESSLVRQNNYSMSAIDVSLNQARRSSDLAVQNAAYQEAQALIQPVNTVIPLWQDVVSVLYRSEISGVALEATYYLHYERLTRQ